MTDDATVRDIIRKIEAVLARETDRDEVSQWARTHADVLQRDAAEVFDLLRRADHRIAGTQEYFVRDYDLREWLADLRHEDPTRPGGSIVAPIRSWQARTGIEAHVIELAGSFSLLCEHLGLKPRRSWVDGLAECEFIAFELPSGHQACIEDFWNGRRDLVVHLELSPSDPQGTVDELLAICALSKAAVLWRNPEFFGEDNGREAG